MRFTKEELLKIIKEEISNLAEQKTPRHLQGPTASGPNTTPRHLQGPTASGPAKRDDDKKEEKLDRVEELLANLLKQLREV
jgi:hypothetical protein